MNLIKIIQLILCVFLIYQSPLAHAMAEFEAVGERVIMGAAEEAGVTGIEIGAERAAAESIAEKMGISLQDIGKLDALPEEAQAAFKQELKNALKGLSIGAKGELKSVNLDAIANVRSNFANQLNKIIPEKGNLFSNPVREYLINVTDAKIAFPQPFELPKPKISGFKPSAEELTPAEKQVQTIESQVATARQDLQDAIKLNKGNLEAPQVKEFDKQLTALQKQRADSLNSVLAERQQNLRQLQGRVKEAPNTKSKIEAEESAEDASKETNIAAQKTINTEYEDAYTELYGADKYKRTALGRRVDQIQEANNTYVSKMKNLNDLKSRSASPAEIEAAQKEADIAYSDLQTARAQYGGKWGKLRNANEEVARTEQALKDAKAKVPPASEEELKQLNQEADEAKQELKTSQSEWETAKRDFDEKHETFIQKGEGAKAFGMRLIDKLKTSLFDQLVSGVIGGFAFSIPNFVIGPIESAENTKAEYDNLMMPRKFGRIWMQIPAQLINDRLPSGSKYIYVKLDKNPGDTVTKHDENADKPSYLQSAQVFMSRDDYDRYAESAISDPNFPNYLVNADTGFFFNWDNTAADSEMKVVPLLEVGKSKRVEKTLANHLDDQAGMIRTGVSKEIFTEDANYTAGYSGSPDLADRLDSQAADAITFKDAPELRAGRIMNAAINQSGGKFGSPKSLFTLDSFRRLTPNQMELLGSSEEPAKAYPYIATGYYVYQTADTPPIQFARNNNLPKRDALWDYVAVLDRNGQQIPFLEPIIDPAGNATYVPNVSANAIISLVTGDKYDLTGRSSKASDAELKNIAIHPDMQNQIVAVQHAVNQLVQDEKYGPFTIGTAKLEIIDKQSIDNSVYVYKRTDRAIESGQTDYLVAMGPDADGKHLVMTQLPSQNIIYFVSLVTSRFYDQSISPVTKNFTFYVNQAADKTFYVSNKSVDPVYSYNNALYEAYLDPVLNKIKPTADQIQAMIKRGATQQVAELLPIPNQWALSSVGLFATYDDASSTGVRIGDFLNQKASQIRKLIDGTYTQWKNVFPNIPEKYRETELGPYQWVNFGPVQISLMATSLADIQNGNYIYQSKQYPDEYLALADSAGATVSSMQNFASEFNVSNPQRYAISLSSGAVYDRDSAGEQTSSISDLKGLFDAAQRSKNFLPDLATKIKNSQLTYQANVKSTQIGIFGPFTLFIDLQDLQSGQFIYADATGLINKYNQPLSDADQKKMLAEVTDYYVTMQTPNHVHLSDPTLDTSKIIYGLKLGGDTDYIVSYITGAMYDRGGAFAGFYEKIDPRGTGIELGFQKWIFASIMKTWQASDFNPSTKQNIDRLNKQTIQDLQQQEQQLADLRLQEAKRAAPLGGTAEAASNMIANLKAAPYVALLANMAPPRNVKLLNNKYYAVSTDNNVIVDFNVGDAGKDNQLGKIYDGQGAPQLELTGWALENIRLYNGVTVQPNGQQSISIGIDHPTIPMNRMVNLNRNRLTAKLTAAESAYQAQEQAYKKRVATTKNLSVTDLANFQKQMLSAATSVGFARQEISALPAVENAGSKLGNITITFYYNEDTASYFVRMQSPEIDIYFDLVSGYGFNLDGTPHIARLPVYHNTDANAASDDYFIGGLNDVGLFAAMYRDIFLSDFKLWSQSDREEISDDGNTINYPVTSTDGLANNILYNRVKNEYDTYSSGMELIKTGNYSKTNLFATRLTYALTKTKSNPNGEYNSADDPLIPVILIWDGKSDLNFQSIIYPFDVDSITGLSISNLAQLKSAGAGKYTASYTLQDGSTKTITISKEQKQINRLSGQWITITDGDKTFQFLYNTSLLDPSFVASCPAETPSATDIITLRTKLGYLKQCEWKLNVVVDSFGVPRLVKELPDSVTKASVTVPEYVPNRGSIQNIMNQKAQLIQQDVAGNRFVYLLNASADANWPYFESRFDGWYVDLSSGILYDTILDPQTYGHYPRGSLKPSQLTSLLDRLNVSVVMNPQGVYELRYRGAVTTQPTTTVIPRMK